MKRKNALVLTHGYLDTINAKTCHGLLRYSSRFKVKAVIDERYAGSDAGDIMNGKNLGIPVLDAVSTYYNGSDEQVDYLIIGVATHGGLLPDSFVKEIKTAINEGCSIVNGLHDYLSAHDDISSLASEKGVELIDIRRPKEVTSMHFWKGEIYDIKADVLAILGVDCALGKRTTSGLIYEMCNRKGLKTEMIYTGQTGWMQGYKYGFIFDSTLNDFISGELEHAILECDKNEHPELILLEGQSSLRNPSGPAGSEFIVSGNARAVILQIAPERIYFEGYEELRLLLPPVRDEIELINKYGSEVIAATVHHQYLSLAELRNLMIVLEKELEIPVVSPLLDGVDELLRPIKEYLEIKKE